MTDPEFNQTKPIAGKSQYRVQSFPDLKWSEWRYIYQPIKEELIVSIQLSEWVTKEQANEFAKQIKVTNDQSS